MSRKSKIEPVREFLEKSKNECIEKMYTAMNERLFLDAEIYNRIIEDILNPAIRLCGGGKTIEVPAITLSPTPRLSEEKTKEDKKENE